MCTIAVCREAFRFYSLVVAMNRDEQLDRPAEPPRIWDGKPRMFAPFDPITGGTWWGVNEYGVFIAITNRDGYEYQKDTIMKRGMLVPLGLEYSRTAEEALEKITSFDGSMFNAFHLLIADRHGNAYVALGDAGKDIEDRLAPEGLFLVTNQGVGESHSPRALQIQEKFFGNEEVSGIISSPPRPSSLGQLLDLHETREGYDDACCIHERGSGHGTVSSTIVRLNKGQDGKSFWELWHREKPDGWPNCYGQWVKLEDFPIVEP